jgi:hypothetical protein
MPPTRPQAGTPEDYARWHAELEQWQDRLESDTQFRDTMTGFAARAEEKLKNITEAQRQHDADDARRFALERRARKRLAKKVEQLGSQVTQTVNTNKQNWTVVVTWASAFVAIAGAGWALIEKFGGALGQ